MKAPASSGLYGYRFYTMPLLELFWNKTPHLLTGPVYPLNKPFKDVVFLPGYKNNKKQNVLYKIDDSVAGVNKINLKTKEFEFFPHGLTCDVIAKKFGNKFYFFPAETPELDLVSVALYSLQEEPSILGASSLIETAFLDFNWLTGDIRFDDDSLPDSCEQNTWYTLNPDDSSKTQFSDFSSDNWLPEFYLSKYPLTTTAIIGYETEPSNYKGVSNGFVRRSSDGYYYWGGRKAVEEDDFDNMFKIGIFEDFGYAPYAGNSYEIIAKTEVVTGGETVIGYTNLGEINLAEKTSFEFDDLPVGDDGTGTLTTLYLVETSQEFETADDYDDYALIVADVSMGYPTLVIYNGFKINIPMFTDSWGSAGGYQSLKVFKMNDIDVMDTETKVFDLDTETYESIPTTFQVTQTSIDNNVSVNFERNVGGVLLKVNDYTYSGTSLSSVGSWEYGFNGQTVTGTGLSSLQKLQNVFYMSFAAGMLFEFNDEYFFMNYRNGDETKAVNLNTGEYIDLFYSDRSPDWYYFGEGKIISDATLYSGESLHLFDGESIESYSADCVAAMEIDGVVYYWTFDGNIGKIKNGVAETADVYRVIEPEM